MNEREALEQQLRDLEAQKVTLFDSGSADQVEVGRLNEKIKGIQQQLSNLEREEAIDEKVHADEIPFSITGVDISGFPVEVIQFVEEVVKEDRKRIYNEHAIELEQLETKLKECESVGLERGLEIDRLIGDKLQSIQENALLNDQLYNVVKELADAQAKRDAAVAEKEDNYMAMDAEIQGRQAYINELKAKLAEYEQAEEYRQRQEQPLAVSAEESTSLQEKADAVKKLFTRIEDWGSSVQVFKPDGTFEMVKRGVLAEEWEKDDNVPDTVESVENEVTEFRGIEAPEIPTVQEHTTNGEVDAVAVEDGVTRSEFEALKGRVDILFENQMMAETAYKEAS